MENSSTVRGHADNMNEYFSDYISKIENLNSIWEGASYENLKGKAEEFKNTYSTEIKSKLNSYASACDEYENFKTQYDQREDNKQNARERKAAASNTTDTGRKQVYEAEASKYETAANENQKKMDEIDSKIQSILSGN